jgi:hypothetical protein
MPYYDPPATKKYVTELEAEIERLRAALAEIAGLKGEDLYRSEDDNQAAYLARVALNPE